MGFAQAVIACEPAMGSRPSLPDPFQATENPPYGAPAVLAGRMEIVLRLGPRVIVDKDVDASALARVIDVLGRRQ
jgi:hypothetical protein